MSSRELPGHIRAAIDRNLKNQHHDVEGRPADSAGIAWAGRDLSGSGIDGSENPLHAFDTDGGLEDPAWLKMRDQLLAGEATEAEAVQVFSSIRVFAAVVPTTAETSTHQHDDGAGTSEVHGDKQADVALVSLQAADGRRALPVFTSVPALTRWHSGARPVAVWMPRACLSAVDEGAELVVVDPSSELTFVVRRPAVWALAQQKEWVPSYADTDLAGTLSELVDLVPGLSRIALAPGVGVGTKTASGQPIAGGGAGPELKIIAYREPGLDETGTKLMVATLQQLLKNDEDVTLKVDTVEISVA